MEIVASTNNISKKKKCKRNFRNNDNRGACMTYPTEKKKKNTHTRERRVHSQKSMQWTIISAACKRFLCFFIYQNDKLKKLTDMTLPGSNT